jgi:hypothetical protein
VSQRGREAERQRGREAERQRGIEAERQRGREAERQRGREAEAERQRQGAYRDAVLCHVAAAVTAPSAPPTLTLAALGARSLCSPCALSAQPLSVLSALSALSASSALCFFCFLPSPFSLAQPAVSGAARGLVGVPTRRRYSYPSARRAGFSVQAAEGPPGRAVDSLRPAVLQWCCVVAAQPGRVDAPPHATCTPHSAPRLVHASTVLQGYGAR